MAINIAQPASIPIGLTGGIGSGKSATATLFEQRGIETVDADVLAREVVMPGQPALQHIAEHFGPTVLNSDGSLNRTWLRQHIFADDQERLWLEGLLHPLIRQLTVERLAQAQSPYVLLVSPLLFESGQAQLVQQTIVVDVPEAMQVQRASQRDINTHDQIKAVMSKQWPRHRRLEHADYIIDNAGDLQQLQLEVARVHTLLMASIRP
ncbi:dephospho-CoA kinase [Pokkaliibacter sp. MBI-7]|uniref:dephospho-CoA kinase n=1 Tax=Pokkaliibacter sp. MBI-7 TaxID=3040600 RepID=UPI0024479AAA|nr:dephospho-CoA kinase [Pokkaliibacter sp. MBI-7]MDH2436399.1 dephospho-CoA kinase [Pokkaliibacter sp. MBI-7]